MIDAGFDATEIFAPLYEDFLTAQCSCGRTQTQRPLEAARVEGYNLPGDVPYCTHAERSGELEEGCHTGSTRYSYGTMVRNSSVFHEGMDQESDEGWGNTDTKETQV